MNEWIKKADAIKEKYKNAAKQYNKQTLKVKREQYSKEMQSLLSQYQSERSARGTVVTARLQEISEQLKPTPIFRLDHYFKEVDVKDSYGIKTGTKKVVDVDYIAGVKYLNEYVKKTLSGIDNFGDYDQAMKELMDGNSLEVVDVLSNLIKSDEFRPKFLREDETAENSSVAQAVKQLHGTALDKYEELTVPKEIRDMQAEKQALIRERMAIVGISNDQTLSYLNNTNSDIQRDGHYSNGSNENPFFN